MNVFTVNLLVIVVVMTSVWILSTVIRDASIVDIVWGAGFVVVAWSSWITSDADGLAALAVRVCVTVWGLRLAGYLAWRNLGKGEDFRYQAMRRKYGARFPLISFVTVFLLQGALMWIVSLPVQVVHDVDPQASPVLVVGVVVWVVGLAFEVVGDLQLARFKADPASAGRVMDTGLWRYTRHPNYFGDFLVWWGIAIMALSNVASMVGVIGAVVMSVLLMRVSGVPMLEHSMAKRRPGYVEYQRRTSAFFPRPPRD
jgi:steroid 5-alpha reductase family enzyme